MSVLLYFLHSDHGELFDVSPSHSLLMHFYLSSSAQYTYTVYFCYMNRIISKLGTFFLNLTFHFEFLLKTQ